MTVPYRRALAALFLTFYGLPMASFAQAPNITATKTDSTPAATKKNPGDTVTYTNVISNAAGAGAATGLQFTDPDVAGSAVVASSVKVSPIAFDDAYPGVIAANTTIDTATSTGFNILTNDFKGLAAGVTATLTISTTNVTSANGGTVVIAAGGTFTYSPAPGFVGNDSFNYTITNNSGTLSNTGSVSLTVSGPVVWYVNAGTGNDTTGNGTLAKPFATVNKAATVDAANHKIFVATGTYATTGVTLESGESLIGQGSGGGTFDAFVLGLTPTLDTLARPILGGTRPTLSGGTVITLAAGNTIRGVDLNSTSAGSAISGSNVATATIGGSPVDTFITSSSAGSFGVNLNGGTGAITIHAPINATAGAPLSIANRTGGTVTLNSKVSSSGTATALSLTTNGATTINLHSVVLATSSNTAFSATGSGTLTLVNGATDGIDNDGNGGTDEPDEANTLATTTGTALNLNGVTVGAGHLVFQSIASNGGSAAGIIIRNTGSSPGTVFVTGTGTAGSGGTIQNKTGSDVSSGGLRTPNGTTDGTGIYLGSAGPVSLDRMILQGFSNFAVYANGATGFKIDHSMVSGTNGENVAQDEGGMRLLELTGTCSFLNSTFGGNSITHVVRVVNTSGTLGLTINGSTFTNPTLATGDDGLFFEAGGTATITANVFGNTFTANRGDHFQAAALNSGNLNISFKGNTLTGGHATALGAGVTINAATGVPGYAGTVNYDIDNNLINGAISNAIIVNLGTSSSAASFNGFIRNNTIGTVGSAKSGSLQANGIGIDAHGNGTHTCSVTGNTVIEAFDRGISVLVNDGTSGILNLTVQGNDLDQSVSSDPLGSRESFFINNGSTSTNVFGQVDAANLRLNFGGAGALANLLDHGVGSTDDFRVRQRFQSRIEMPGYGGTPFDNAAVVTYLSGRNTLSGGATASATSQNDVGSVNDGYFSASSVPFPTVTPLPLLFAENLPETRNPAVPADQDSSLPAEAPTAAATLSDTPSLLQAGQLDSLVAEAITRWETTGLTHEQTQILRRLRFELSDLDTLHLGQANGDLIQISPRAAGNEWFIDPTPADDAEFSRDAAPTRRGAMPNDAALHRVDLLTTLLHEMGHALGLGDSYSNLQRDSLMFGFLSKGERRLPSMGQAMGATPHDHNAPHFLAAPIDIGDLPPGKSVTIIYDVVINDPLTTVPLTSQGTVSGSNFANKLTDDLPGIGDPALPGAADPTVTLIERPDTTVASLNRSAASPTNASSITWQIVFANPLDGLTAGNFALVNTGLGGSPAITGVTAVGTAPVTTWNITATTGTGDGTLGLNLANDVALTYDVINKPFTGQVYTIDRTGPGATLVVADSALRIGETSLVTITFNEAVTGFANADLTVPNGTLSAVITSDNITWTATFTPGPGIPPGAGITDATNLITLDNIGVQDAAGNTGTGTTDSNNYAIDTARPTASIVVADTELLIGETSPVTITFSEAVSGFDNTDLTIANGTLSPVATSDNIIYTAIFTPTPNVTDPTNVITLDNTGVTDAAGNTGTGTTDSNNYAVTSLSISIAAVTGSAAEGNGAGTTAFTFSVSRTGSTTGGVTMDYAVTGAADAADFGGTLPSGVFTIPDGQTGAVLTVQVSKDTTREPNENFTVTLGNASGGYVLTTAAADSTIANDDFEADLAITVTDGVTTVTPGGSVTYTITASNAGLDPVVGATLADTFPASLSNINWTAVGAGGGTATAAGSGNINDTLNLPVGASVTYTVSATISSSATGTLVNTATVSSTVTDPNPANNSATDTDTLTPQADLSITKTDGVATAISGGSVTYTITASNSGPSSVTGATVADTLPGIISGATWTAVGAGGGSAPANGSGNINALVNLPVGASVTFTVSATISSAATGTLVNTATIGSAVTDPNPANNSATDTDTLTPQADLAITKTDGVTTAVPGSSVTYTITASNSGLSQVTGATVSDTFPASLTATWIAVGAGGGSAPASGSGNINAPVTLPPGGSVTFTVSATISASATGTLSNTVTVTAPAGVTDPNPGNNSATDTDTLTPQADLTLTKTDGVTTATPGGSVTYTITASNAGPSSVPAATVADTLPASIIGATWTATGAGGGMATAVGAGNINDTVNLPVGGSVTYTVTAPISAAATGTLSNTATVSSTVIDPTPANNSATDTDTLNAQADLAITKTDGITTATPGGSVTYTITASNAGPSNVTAATVADTLPAIISGATWTATGAGGGTATASGSGNINDTVNLPAGGSVTYTVTAPISAAATGTLVNTATVSSAVTDPTPANNSATDTDTLTPQADLAITKTDGVATAVPGNSVTYTITASNAGPSNVIGATVADTLPAIISGATWTATGAGGGTATAAGSGNINDTVNLPVGGSVTYTVTAPISSSATGTLVNTATVSSSVTDPNSANNSATDTDTLTPQADLAVTLTDSPDPVNAGGDLTYTITLRNNGPSARSFPSVFLQMSASTTFVSATVPGDWHYNTASQNGVFFQLTGHPQMIPGEFAIFTVVAKVSLSVVNNSILTATATVSSSETDPTPGNDSATTTTTAKSGADLQITLADSPDPVVAGTNLTYTFQVANNGPLDADNVSVTDTLPVGTTFVSLATPAGWTATTPAVGGTGSVTITRSLFAVSGSATFTLVVKVGPAVANGTIVTNTASVTSTTVDIVPGNNSATATSTVTTQSDLAIQISGTPATAPKGSNVTYAITLTNNGPSNASAPNVSLPVPSQMTFVSATAAAGWSATTPAVGANGTVNFSAASLASGATVNFTVVAKVNANAPTGAILTAIVTASAAGVEPVPANNVAASIAAVGTVKPTAVQPVTTGFAVNPQTGLFDINVKVTNTTPLPINGFRLRVNFDAYKAAYPSLRLENATSTSKKTNVYIDYPNAMAVNATVTVKLSFYTSTRTFPSPFAPGLTVDLLATAQAAPIVGGGVQASLAKLPDKTIQLAFPTVAGRWYRVRYSSDLEHWTDCQVPVMATSDSTMWIDNGPPYTVETPANTPARFYLIHEIEAP